MEKRLQELRERFAKEPLVKLLGIELLHLHDGEALMEMKARDEFAIVGGVIQGGIITALADYAGVYAAMTKIPAGHTPAAHIDISFRRPAKVGEVLWAWAYERDENPNTLVIGVEVNKKGERARACATIVFSKPKSENAR